MRDKWILDRLLRIGGVDVLWPDVTGILTAMGFNYSDITRGTEGMGSVASMSARWRRLGDAHFERAAHAAREDHLATAAESFHRAAGCYARARFGVRNDEAERIEIYERLVDAYMRCVEYGDAHIERVEISTPDGDLPALLHLPAAMDHLAPCALVLPGMDMTKEYFPIPHANLFTRRGMACLVMDPPGHGESLVRGVKMTARNVEEAGKAALDFLEAREDLDGGRLGIFGIGTGSYFAVSLATQEQRLQAVVSFEGAAFYDKLRFIADNQPTFEARLRAMTGLSDPEFQECLRLMTMEGREHLVGAPWLLVMGEWDEHVTHAEVERLFGGMRVPRQIVVYEGESHVLGGVAAEALQFSADWLADRLGGEPLNPVEQRTLIPSL